MFQRFSFKPEAHLEYIFGSPPDGNLDIYGWNKMVMNSGLHGTAPDILYVPNFEQEVLLKVNCSYIAYRKGSPCQRFHAWRSSTCLNTSIIQICICDLHLWSCCAAVMLLLYFVLRHLLVGEPGATAFVVILIKSSGKLPVSVTLDNLQGPIEVRCVCY